MPKSPPLEPLDDRLTEMGRALANSLLGEEVGSPRIERPVRAPQAQRAPIETSPVPSVPARARPVASQPVANGTSTLDQRPIQRARVRPSPQFPQPAPPSEWDRLPPPPAAARPSAPAPGPAAARPSAPAQAPAPSSPPASAHSPSRALVRPADPATAFSSLPWPTDEKERSRDEASSAPRSEIPLLEPRKAAPAAPEAPAVQRKRERRPAPAAKSTPESRPLAESAPARPKPASKSKRFGRAAHDWAIAIGAAVLVAVLLQAFVLQVYRIPSASMWPTLQVSDRVAVNKLAYSIGGGVERGDLVVFHRPATVANDDPDQPAQLIKRVIGLPGDVVETRAGVVYVNGKPLAETGEGRYLSPDVVTNNLPQPVNVPRGSYFVMGDNREHSLDSRFFGVIDESSIIGRAVAITWPFGRWGTL